MLRAVSAALRGVVARATTATNSVVPACCLLNSNYAQYRNFGALSTAVWKYAAPIGSVQCKPLLSYAPVESRLTPPVEPINVPVRTVTKFSLNKGKRRTVKAVVDRFFRLHWGIWIRTRAGRKKKMWKKSSKRKKRLFQHVFCNATQSKLLDKMVTKYWRRPHYYVDDPYEPYHKREEFVFTRRKPLP